MGIMDKVEEIRKKPEHIRMRYVWFFVAVSMFFVITLWILSLEASRQENPSTPADNSLFKSDIIDQFGEQKKTLNDTRDKLQNSFSNPERVAPGSPQSEAQNNQIETNLNNGAGQ